MTASDREVLDRLIRIETMLQPLVDHRAQDERDIRELQRTAVTREDLDRQHRRTLALTGVIVSVIAVLVPSGISIIAIVVMA